MATMVMGYKQPERVLRAFGQASLAALLKTGTDSGDSDSDSDDSSSKSSSAGFQSQDSAGSSNWDVSGQFIALTWHL